MPGVFNLSVDEAVKEAQEVHSLGVPSVILFGLPDKKDEVATGAWADDGIVQQAARAMKREVPDLILMGDVCLCEYMSHGHCGIVKSTFTPQSLGAAVIDAMNAVRAVAVKSKEEKTGRLRLRRRPVAQASRTELRNRQRRFAGTAGPHLSFAGEGWH